MQVVDLADLPESFTDRLHACGRALPGPVITTPVFTGVSGPCGAIVVPSWRAESEADWEQALLAACERHDLVAVHAMAATMELLVPTWHRLRAVAPIAADCARQLGRSFDLDLAMPARIATSLPEVEQRFVLRRFLGPLMLQDGAHRHAPAQVEAVEAVYAHSDRAAAAETLHVSPGTVRHRLRRVEDLTGLDLHRDRLLINTAITLYRLYEELPPPGDPWWDHGQS